VPIQNVTDIQSLSRLELKRPNRSETRILRWYGYILILFWAVRQVNIKEGLGQVMRIVGAATKTAIGLVPSGNTGGTNVSPFKVLPVSPKLAIILAKANSQATPD